MISFTIIVLSVMICSVTGQRPFNYNTETCCNGQVFDKKANKLCCNGTSVDTDGIGQKAICCGHSAIEDDPRKVCCNGKMIPIEGGTVIGKYKYACCEYQVFNPEKQVCCGGQVDDNPNDLKGCCGGEFYDFQKSLCCAGIVMDVNGDTANYACCGDDTYNYKTEVCCYDTGTVLGLPEDNTYPSYVYSCCADKLVLPGQECCHGIIFNPSTIVVNGIRRSSYCCWGGGIVQDSSAEACCPGGVIPIDRPGLGCCGNLPYDYKTQICCDDGITDRDSKLYYACCGKQPFDSYNEFCCNGEIYESNGKQNACCEKWQ